MSETTSIGEKIKAIRTNNKMSRVAFAALMDISVENLCRIEAGDAEVDLNFLLRLSSLSGIKYNFVLQEYQEVILPFPVSDHSGQPYIRVIDDEALPLVYIPCSMITCVAVVKSETESTSDKPNYKLRISTVSGEHFYHQAGNIDYAISQAGIIMDKIIK